MKYANFGQRFLGWLIDIIILFPISWIIHKSQIGDNVVLSQLIYMLFEGCYFIFFWTKKRFTVGMWLMRIRLQTESPLTIKGAIKRYIGLNISIFCFGIGSLWMLWDKKKQMWHDKLAGTYVVKVEK